MGNNNVQIGIVIIIVATFFLLVGLDMVKYTVFDMNQRLSTLIAFVLIAAGVYFISKK